MEMFVYFNGDFIKASEARVSIFDHGFLYGDGLFETLRVYDGMPFKFEEHMDRFYSGANYLGINVPLVRSVIRKAIEVLIEKNNLEDAVARVMLTRGEGDIGLDTDLCPNPTILITVRGHMPLSQEIYDNGIKLTIVSKLKTPPQVIDPSVKSNNYLSNILARAEAKEKGAFEGIMLNIEGYVAECTTSNIFLIKNDQIVTPTLASGILKGIARETVIEIANSFDITVEERFVLPEEIYDADECFITNSLMEIVPVSECDGTKISNGNPGIVTMNIMKEYKKSVQEYVRLFANAD